MTRKKVSLRLAALLAALLAVFFIGCAQDSSDSEEEDTGAGVDEFGTHYTADGNVDLDWWKEQAKALKSADRNPYFPVQHVDRRTFKLNVAGRPVVNTMWAEPEEDPRTIMGYVMNESRKPFFDRYVILYGGRIANWDCAGQGVNVNGDKVSCKKTGFHLHFDDNVLNCLENHNTYYRPLQEKGIKVLMGLVPHTGGVCAGTLYEWPMEEYASWSSIYSREYDFGPEAAEKFAQEVIEALNKYELDGVGYDEEYAPLKGTGGKGLGTVYPDGGTYGTNSDQTKACWVKGGGNILRFAARLQELKPDIVQEVYEIRYGAYLPLSVTVDGKTINRYDVIDISYEPNYGSDQKSGMDPEMSNNRYGRWSMDIGATSGGSKPSTASALKGNMEQHLQAGYGVNMYYCLRSRAEMQSNFASFFWGSWQPEVFLSEIGKILYGDTVVYQGDDYARLW